MLEESQPQEAVHGLKTTPDGLVLDPQPSDNPNDPLNWKPSRKALTLSIWALACFSCQVTATTNTQGSYLQVPLYHKTATQISLSVSFALIGLMVGAIFIVPLSRRYSSCFCLFWSTIGLLLTSVWSALMAGSSDYNPFLVSRLVAGLCASVPLILGSEVVLQTFFRHQRGKCLHFLHIPYLLGIAMGPTIGAYIDSRASWTISFWYTVPLNGVLAILILAFLEDTHFTGEEQTHVFLLQRKWNTYARGRAIPPSSRASWAKFLFILFDILLVTVSPVSIIMGFFIMVDFGFATMSFILNVTFLEAPRDEGGYGMSKMAVASFTLTQTIGVLLAEVYGHFISDRLPLYLLHRKFNTNDIEPTDWRPELRLHCLWLPVILLPTGLGLFGASLEYHFHWAILALGYLLISVGAISILPITMTYLCECFPDHVSEVAAALGIWRLILGLLTTVFITPWYNSVGPGWVFGSAGLFTIPGFVGVVVLMGFGGKIRSMGFRRLRK
ncbi:polyamine transporter [Aspergillus sclerotioniger CBS 115572]|uniref:Polyamine transporter n=1 Tax=Aspergillus sclerotioniger CBS 115572 TaxID=1450535 RepID=A0A317X4F4_9EURO|nr:polyamine transporter [Aspergillus sclerotioniger CBS 115572]PWY93446.1 polyamine transporter [Aspergillus sclerotioniger CBS 115572]